MTIPVSKRTEAFSVSSESGVPSLFGGSGISNYHRKSIAKINKIGSDKAVAKRISYGGITHISDLKGFEGTLKSVKKENVANQPRAIRKLSSRPSNSYLHKRAGKFKGKNTDRPKVNILSLVDDAIEDGATNEAKQKASAERAAATAPIPAALKKPLQANNSSFSKEQVSLQESLKEPRSKHKKSGSTGEKVNDKAQDSEGESVKSASNYVISPVPAWKARLRKQGKEQFNIASTEKKRLDEITEKNATLRQSPPKVRIKPWETRMKAQGKKISEQLDPSQKANADACDLLNNKKATTKPKQITETLTNVAITPNTIDVNGKGKGYSKAKKVVPVVKKNVTQSSVGISSVTKDKPSLPSTRSEPITAQQTDLPKKETTENNVEPETEIKMDVDDPLVNFLYPHLASDDTHDDMVEQEVENSKYAKKLNSPENPYRLVNEQSAKTLKSKEQIMAVGLNNKTSCPSTRSEHITAQQIDLPKKEKTKNSIESETEIKMDITNSSVNFPYPHLAVYDNHDNKVEKQIENDKCSKCLNSPENPYGPVNERSAKTSKNKEQIMTIDLNKVEREESDDIKVKIEEPISGARETHNPISSKEGGTKKAVIVDDNHIRLRKELEETKQRLDNVAIVFKEDLREIEKEFRNKKEIVRFRLMKKINAHEKINAELFEEYQERIDENQREIDEVRLANQRLRLTIEKLPKQVTELKLSNQSLETANKDAAGHTEQLGKFAKKLQTDQGQLLESSDKCKNEFLPRYRHELWERQQYLDAEINIKNLYRDCLIKITKRIEKSRQIQLFDEVAMMVIETEGEVNPKFDPNFLFAEDDNSDDSSTSDYSSIDSDSGSDDSDYE
uniref:Uncharacterized protein n=1 Tax=Pseudo-nitzschia australis TaxID=44445 RepID=A0A6V0AMK1_9STRA